MDQAQRERVIQGLGACLEPRGERERVRERERHTANRHPISFKRQAYRVYIP